MSGRRMALLLIAVCLVACGSGSKAAAKCPNPSPPPTQPKGSGVWFGAALDWEHQTLDEYAKQLGHAPAFASTFAEVPLDAGERKNVDNVADQARRAGSMLLLTLEPNGGLNTVTTAVARDVAHQINGYNRKGVPVIVRFAEEMNGSWYVWGQKPEAFISAFRRVATAVHELAPGSSMMWAPNYGGGYPFAPGEYLAKPGTRAFKLLDTNNDGKLTQADDPYAPYWPGRAAVDWVGLSLFHWGTDYPRYNNAVPEPGKFVDQLRGTYNGIAGDDRSVPDFYAIYGARKQLPVAIADTASMYVPGRPGATALAVKRGWWRQLFSDTVHRQLPWLRLINWFEWYKYEPTARGKVDWTITRNPAVRAAFRADVPSWVGFAADVPPCNS